MTVTMYRGSVDILNVDDLVCAVLLVGWRLHGEIVVSGLKNGCACSRAVSALVVLLLSVAGSVLPC